MVDRIKPPSGDIPSNDDAASPITDRGKVREFPKVRGDSHQLVSAGDSHSALGVVATFRKAELGDGEKLKTMIRATISELVDGESKNIGPMSQGQRETVLNLLSDNPFVRQKMHNYLSTVLS